MREVPELLLIDKPLGVTSMDVIRQLRRRLGIKKIGHAGTLDPLATGLMLVGVGSGTKRLADLIKLDKEYVAEVRIGEQRTTGDLEGEVVAENTVLALTEAEVKVALETLLGTHEYAVSAYSAIKVGGVPMYKRARAAAKAGEAVAEVPMRSMTVYQAELLKLEVAAGRAVATVRFLVGSGTYIRSLGEALGAHLGYPATLQALRRTQVGEYRIEDAQKIEDFDTFRT
jgi:tRNA pseudouridine55 synthase